MKAIIFTMTCGEGHNMMARSLEQAFKNKNIKTKIVQTFGYNEKRVARENKMFLWACKHIPHIYDFVWNKLRKVNHKTDKCPGYVKTCVNYFKKEIESYDPDIIVCTHCYASSVISYMKKKNMLKNNIITSTVLFDFCLAPYWEHSTAVDYIFQPLDNTTKDLIEKGFAKKQIITSGIPVKAEFYEKYNKEKIREELKLQNMFTVMNIGGGNGLGNTLKLLKSLLKSKNKIQIIIINGKNKKNYEKIKKFINDNKITNVINLGFVNNVDMYMKASDLIISRCGGCGLSEIFAINKPFIIREKMILNEKINKQFFIENGCALGMDKITDAGDRVEYLINNPKIYDEMIKNIEKIRKPNSSEKIVEFLISKVKK